MTLASDKQLAVDLLDTSIDMLDARNLEIIALRSQRDELLEALQSTLRIVEALSYHTQLGRSQRERLDKAKALSAQLTAAQRSAS